MRNVVLCSCVLLAGCAAPAGESYTGRPTHGFMPGEQIAGVGPNLLYWVGIPMAAVLLTAIDG